MTITPSTPTLNSVISIKATSDRGVFILRCIITDMDGSSYDTDYCTRPDDSFGLNPTIQQWIADNPFFPVQPHAPATVKETRAMLPPLTTRQLRLGLLDAGIPPARVTTAIEAMPTGSDKEKAQIEWEYATTFDRYDHLIGTIGSALRLSDAEIDAMWTNALGM